jgi:hypothetical protein
MDFMSRLLKELQERALGDCFSDFHHQVKDSNPIRGWRAMHFLPQRSLIVKQRCFGDGRGDPIAIAGVHKVPPH